VESVPNNNQTQNILNIYMYTESLDNFPSAELMHLFTSTQTSTDNANTVNPDYNINNLDFTIYSQTPSTLTTDYLENELYNSLQIGQQAPLVNQQETQIDDVTNYSENIPLNNHTVEDYHYTTPDQSNFVVASPHGYSENNIATPLLEPYINNNGPYSVQSTPLLSENQLLFSPIYHSPALSDLLFDDIGSTPTVGTPYTTTVHSCTPLITPNTPYLNTPYIANNSPFSVASSTINTPFAFQTSILDTPVEANALYDEGGKSSSWFSLFDSVSTDPLKTTAHYNYSAISQPFEYQNMEVVNIETIEKKVNPSEMVHESPKSENSTPIPSDKTTSITSPTAVENTITTSIIETDTSKIIVENNSGIIETIKTETIATVNQTPDSAPTTPVDNPKLVAIRPRPQDDEDSGENDSTRRSKRQRTMSISEENDDENEDEAEKKYNCPDCGRGFNRKFNMQTHRQTHDPNRVKPFACEHPNCGSRFTRKHDLKRHINGIHKGEKVHECTVCRKPFSRKDAWKRHIATCGKV